MPVGRAVRQPQTNQPQTRLRPLEDTLGFVLQDQECLPRSPFQPVTLRKLPEESSVMNDTLPCPKLS